MKIYTIIIALIVGIYIFYISPIISEKRQQAIESLNEKQALLKRYETLIAEGRAEGKDPKEALERLKKLEKDIPQTKDKSLAIAKLQLDIQDSAEKAGLSVLSIKPGSPIIYNGYTGFPIEMECSGTISGLGELLKTLDTKRGAFKTDRLNISVGSVGDESLRIKIQVIGLAKI